MEAAVISYRKDPLTPTSSSIYLGKIVTILCSASLYCQHRYFNVDGGYQLLLNAVTYLLLVYYQHLMAAIS